MSNSEEFVIKDGILTKYNGKGGSVTIPEGVCEIATRAFKDCASLTSVKIPEGVTYVGFAAFAGCSALTSIVLPDSVNTVFEDAFKDCTSLTAVHMSSRVSVGEAAFWGCDSLKTIFFDGVEHTYSLEMPTEEGHYWHDVEGKPRAWRAADCDTKSEDLPSL